MSSLYSTRCWAHVENTGVLIASATLPCVNCGPCSIAGFTTAGKLSFGALSLTDVTWVPLIPNLSPYLQQRVGGVRGGKRVPGGLELGLGVAQSLRARIHLGLR